MNPASGSEVSRRRATRWLVVSAALVVISVPVSLAIETGARLAFAPPIFERMRMYLRPTMTPIAWWMLLVVAAAAVLGVWLTARLVRRDLDRLAAAGPRSRARAPSTVFAGCPPEMRVVLNRLMILSAVPQVPAILATLLFMFGSQLTPVIVAMTISSAGVLGQAFVAGARHGAHIRATRGASDARLAPDRARGEPVREPTTS